LDAQVNATGVIRPGTYKMTMQSTSTMCYLNIRGRSNIETFVGFTQVNDAFNGATQDDAHFAPIAGASASILMIRDPFADNVAVVRHREFDGGVLNYIQFVNQAGFLFFTAELKPRSRCTFQYYATKTFGCPPDMVRDQSES
jgi:hypothetical protein